MCTFVIEIRGCFKNCNCVINSEMLIEGSRRFSDSD